MSKNCTVEHAAAKTRQRGWFLPYLLGLDPMFSGRWEYWLRVCERRWLRPLPRDPIPQIGFGDLLSANAPTRYPLPEKLSALCGTAGDAQKMLRHLMDGIRAKGGNWTDLLDWFLWGGGRQERGGEVSAHQPGG